MNTTRWRLHRRSLLLLAGAGSALLGDARSSRAGTSDAATPAASPGAGTPAASLVAGETRIRVTIGEEVLTGRLWNNAATRDLVTLLPLTLTFSDHNRLEKAARLPRKLSTEGMPPGDDPVPGDIGYYAPWGDLNFYYGDVGYFDGITRIGQFDGSTDAIESQDDDFIASIELLESS